VRFSITISLVGVLFFASMASAAPAWNLNDVAYLFPLPEKNETASSLLSPTDQDLLPKSLYLKFPLLADTALPVKETKEEFYGELRVVAVRIDPCAPLTLDSYDCDHQVRMVFQAVKTDDSGKNYTTADAGIHVFYRLTQIQMNLLLKQLWDLKLLGLKQNPKVDTTLVPLGVHPAFSNSTYRDQFSNQLKSILLRYCSPENIVQITMARLMAASMDWWGFNGLKKVNDRWVDIKIPRLKNATSEEFFNTSSSVDAIMGFPNQVLGSSIKATNAKHTDLKLKDDFFSRDNPNSKNKAKNLSDVLSDNAGNETARIKQFQDGLTLIHQIENPNLNNPLTMDCVHCHIAEATRYFMTSTEPGLNLNDATDRFKNPNPSLYNLSNHTVVTESTKALRAFGYWRNFPAVSRRVINDAAETAEFLNKR